ncbi:MAG: hypothetical protein JWM46_223 [Candidatus Kaiserbacteria bacterium]|nr:hypothetical protein [Candidatus Kaiserbacteria bacterium]
MEERTAQEIIVATHYPRMFASIALAMLALFLLIASFAELKGYHYIGSGVAATNTITVTGEGQVFAVPDTATFTVSVIETGKDVTTAQTAANTKGNAIIAYLKSQGIDAKDIQTTDYSVNPQYDYSNTVCPSGTYCGPGKQTLVGFQVSDTLTVKVRDTQKAGALLSGVGSKGASSVSSLSFTIDDQKGLEAQARDKAITEAKGKADALAKSLGVSVVRVVGFNENNNQPYYYATKASAGMAMDSVAAAPAPEVAVGQNKITSEVSVTYEIR